MKNKILKNTPKLRQAVIKAAHQAFEDQKKVIEEAKKIKE